MPAASGVSTVSVADGVFSMSWQFLQSKSIDAALINMTYTKTPAADQGKRVLFLPDGQQKPKRHIKRVLSVFCLDGK